MNRRSLVLPALFLGVFATAAVAQETQSDAIAKEKAKNADPQVVSELRTALPALSFSTDTDKKTATAQFGVDRDDRSWLVKISGPLGEGSPKTVLATAENLAAGTTLELNGKRIFWKPPFSADQLKSLCQTYAHKDECKKGEMSAEGQAIVDAGKWSAGMVGTSLKVGRKEFTYVLPADGKDHKDPHTGWSAAATGGWFPSNGPIYFTSLTLRHESAYKGGDEELICSPLPDGSTSTHCRNAATEAPKRQAKNIALVEVRHFVGETAAISPRFTYEQKEKAFSVEVPVYMRDIAGAFNGGTSVAWDSKKHTFAFTLFVGVMTSPTK